MKLAINGALNPDEFDAQMASGSGKKATHFEERSKDIAVGFNRFDRIGKLADGSPEQWPIIGRESGLRKKTAFVVHIAVNEEILRELLVSDDGGLRDEHTSFAAEHVKL